MLTRSADTVGYTCVSEPRDGSGLLRKDVRKFVREATPSGKRGEIGRLQLEAGSFEDRLGVSREPLGAVREAGAVAGGLDEETWETQVAADFVD